MHVHTSIQYLSPHLSLEIQMIIYHSQLGISTGISYSCLKCDMFQMKLSIFSLNNLLYLKSFFHCKKKKKSYNLSSLPLLSFCWFIFRNFLTASRRSHSMLSKYATFFPITMCLLMLFPVGNGPSNSPPVGLLLIL